MMPSTETLLPECVLPGCREAVIEVGQPCVGCVEAFGPMLVPRPGEPMTAEQIQDRDAGVHAMYAAMATPRDQSQRKPNQTCWLCDERRTCVSVAGRWECDACREVTP